MINPDSTLEKIESTSLKRESFNVRSRQPVSRSEEPWNVEDDTEIDDKTFLQRYRLAIIAGLCLIAFAFFAIRAMSHGSSSAARPAPMITMVSLPPPPPPPPKIEPQIPPEQKLMEQPQVMEPETKPEDKPQPPKPDEPPAGLGTGVKGDGAPDGFGLSGSGNGGLFGRGGSKGGSKFGWYAGQVQTKVADALRGNPKTRDSALSIQVRIWADLAGRVTRAQLAGTTGDRALDDELSSRILTGLQLAEPPPAGMPMPIVLRLSARRPN